MERRETLRHYVRALMKIAREEGIPLLCVMFCEFPEEAECGELKDQDMFGDRDLAAPVRECRTRSGKVYLPAGACCRNLDPEETHEGGKRMTVPAPLEGIPVFGRI